MICSCYSMNSICSGLSGTRPLRVPRAAVAGQAGTSLQNMTATKKCYKCLESKLITEFHAHPNTKDGLLGKCKACAARDTRDHYRMHKVDPEWVVRNRAIKRARAVRCPRPKTKRDPEVSRNYYQRNKDKFRAHQRAARAETKGIIVSPGACEWCGLNIAKLEKHHEDYSKPLQVTWLCRACHATTWRK
jgi:hypothetical protein